LLISFSGNIKKIFIGVNNLVKPENFLSSEWDEYAEDWDTDPTVIEYAKNAFKSLATEVDLHNLSVLDFGSGTGALTEIISPLVNSVVALDSSPKMITQLNAKKLKNVSTITDILSKELIDNNQELMQKFDLIIASSVCSFLPDYPSTLVLLKSLLKPNGVFIQWDWAAESENSGMGLTEKAIEHALLQSEFSDIKIKSPFVMKSSKGEMPVIMAIAKNT